MFQFHGECRRKFGLDLGEQIWEEINRCFDAMPICKSIYFEQKKKFFFSPQVLLWIIVFYVFMVVYHH